VRDSVSNLTAEVLPNTEHQDVTNSADRTRSFGIAGADSKLLVFCKNSMKIVFHDVKKGD
jgi:hypothetical protein